MTHNTDHQGGEPLARRLTPDQKDLLSVLAILALTIVIAAITSGGTFLRPQNIINILQQNAVLLVLTVSQLLIVLTRGIDLSVGAVVAFTSVVFIGMTDYGIVPALLAAIAVGIFFGLLNGVLVAFLRLPPFLATMGSMQIIYSGAKVVSGGGTLNASFDKAPIPSEVLTLYERFVGPFPVPTLIFLLVLIASWLFFRSATGHYLYAVGANDRMARLAGIPVNRIRLIAYSLAGGVAAIGGALFSARVGYGDPQAGLWLPLDTIAAVCIGGVSLAGGRGTLVAAMCGVLIIAILNNAMNLIGLPPTLQPAVKGAIILATVYLYSHRSNS
ncbi:MAG: ABC transporter permease [Rhizobiaceae bacterium]|nr:ABC transporter permease [Rhizobiaceae bacterium]